MSGEQWKPLGSGVKRGASKGVEVQRDAETEPAHYVSKRSDLFWKRLREWYPNKLARWPGKDFCEVIDTCSRESLSALLANVRAKHPAWPPTFPEFYALHRQLSPSSINWPDILDRFLQKLLTARAISFEQMQHLSWIHDGRYNFVGVAVPKIGDAPAKRFDIKDWLEDSKHG